MVDEPLFDPAAEKSIISGLFKYNKDAFLAVSDIINENCFVDSFYRACYIGLTKLIEEYNDIKIDESVLLQQLKENRLVTNFSPEDSKLLRAIRNMPLELSNVRMMGAKIAKLQIARDKRDSLMLGADKLNKLQGTESLGEILGIAEESVFDSKYDSYTDDRSARKFGDGLDDYVDKLLDNPVDQIGFPIGLPQFENAIGGGIRGGTLHVIGSRIKTGKTFMADHVAVSSAMKGIPVLILDTEMLKEDHWNRVLAKFSGLKIRDIESGKSDKDKTKAAAQAFKSLPISYKNVGGMSFEEIISLMRKWLIQEVGLNSEGKAKKPCLIVYDYIKLMDDSSITKNIAEYQAIGFLMTKMHNFMVKYSVGCVAFVQLNRNGTTEEDSTVAAQSDRILWLCSSFSIYKWKDKDDLQEEMRKADENERYFHKLIVIVTRHGPGLNPGDFINMKTNYSVSAIEEGPLNSTLGNNDDEDEEDSDTQNSISF